MKNTLFNANGFSSSAQGLGHLEIFNGFSLENIETTNEDEESLVVPRSFLLNTS